MSREEVLLFVRVAFSEFFSPVSSREGGGDGRHRACLVDTWDTAANGRAASFRFTPELQVQSFFCEAFGLSHQIKTRSWLQQDSFRAGAGQ